MKLDTKILAAYALMTISLVAFAVAGLENLNITQAERMVRDRYAAEYANLTCTQFKVAGMCARYYYVQCEPADPSKISWRLPNVSD